MDLWAQRTGDERGTVGDAVPVTLGIEMRSASFYFKGRPVVNAWRVSVFRDRLATWADAEAISSEDAYIEYLDLSPDGTELALNSDRAGNPDLWIVPLNGAIGVH